MSRRLPYNVECDRGGRWFEPIAAFDCESAAMRYARGCADNALYGYTYRVRRGRTIHMIPSGSEPQPQPPIETIDYSFRNRR